ncbi:DUF2059 domain-containing protein [Chitinophaga sp.]|uniref:DUF2059 domain-containing protein n=1 Tax=Chitinophaga sp. TaxID=1869181 RepID=UPI00261D564D|nr:DUF2059 domain-containing protein [uncultured Chitinophaga sp.]
MKKLLFTWLLAAAVTGASAQESAKTIKIRVLLSLNGASRVGMNTVKQMLAQYQKAYPSVDTAVWKRIAGYYNEKDLANLLVPIYERYFSEKDVDGMIAFYKSEAGKKMVEMMPHITAESQAAGKVWGEDIAAKIRKDIEGALK